MSAVAVAYFIYPEIHTLASLLSQRCRVPRNASRGERLILQEAIDHHGAELQAAVRQQYPGRTAEQLGADVESETFPTDALRRATAYAGDPGSVFQFCLDSGLGDLEAEIEPAPRDIILAAPDARPRRGRGRPPTPRAVVDRARELRAEGHPYKETAKRLREQFGTKYTKEAVRRMLVRYRSQA